MEHALNILLGMLGWGVAVLGIAGCAYTLLTAAFVLRFFHPQPTSALEPACGAVDEVTILKPLHGDEPGLRHNLESFFAEARPGATRLLFGVQDPADPATGVVAMLAGAYPDIASRLCIGDSTDGLNRKVANLIQMAKHAQGEVLVISDSDIAAPPGYLDRVLAALAAPGVGVVTCPYAGKGETGLWSHLAAMGLSYQFTPNVITGVSLGMAKPCMGSTIALRRETLARIGGFEAFRNVLADDYAIGAAVRGLGLRSVVAPVVVTHSCAEGSLSAVFSHELRWARTVRGVDPAGHAGSVVTHPLPLALLAAVFLGFTPLSLALIVLALAVRLLLKIIVDRTTGRSSGSAFLFLLRDMLSIAVFVGSFFGRAVVWRGEKFHVTTDGDLKPV